jgi:glycosyltransferase involved in cell wall biosynthesis
LKVSVVVPVLNEAELLKGCLDSIMLQSRVPDEVLVGIDAKTTDNSGLIAESHPVVSKVVYGVADTYPIQKVLCWMAEGDVIVNLDGDTWFVSPNWIEKAVQHLSDPNVHLVTGWIQPHTSNLINELICSFQNNSPLYLSGCSSAFKKTSLQKLTLNGYSEIPLHSFKALGKVVKDPELKVKTRIPTREQIQFFKGLGFMFTGIRLLGLRR